MLECMHPMLSSGRPNIAPTLPLVPCAVQPCGSPLLPLQCGLLLCRHAAPVGAVQLPAGRQGDASHWAHCVPRDVGQCWTCPPNSVGNASPQLLEK